MYQLAASPFTQLKRVRNVVRMGHVERIHTSGLELTGGEYALPEDTVYIDCSADGLAKRPAQAICKVNASPYKRFCPNGLYRS